MATAALITLFTTAVQLVTNLTTLFKTSQTVLKSEDADQIQEALQTLQQANDDLHEALQARLRG